jgi:hypothetical protein
VDPAAHFRSLLEPGETLVWSDRVHARVGFVARLAARHAWRFATVSPIRIVSTVGALALMAIFTVDFGGYLFRHQNANPVDRWFAFFGFFAALSFLGVVPALIVIAARVRHDLLHAYGVTDRGRALVASFGSPRQEFAARPLPPPEEITTHARGNEEFGDIQLGPDGLVFRHVSYPLIAIEAIRAAAANRVSS